jgi:Tol biopolymer transport system component
MAADLRNLARWLALVVALVPALVNIAPVAADAPATDAFWRTWVRHDRVVTEGGGPRTWMWGPAAVSGPRIEPYVEGTLADGTPGYRLVQYFDKSRMEITVPDADPTSEWFVTNGLLVVELVTGRLQLGHASFDERQPAEVNVAGDPEDASGPPGGPTPPTYASFGRVLDIRPDQGNLVISTGIQRDGTFYTYDRFAHYAVRTLQYVPATRHWVAAPFWAFMTSSGDVFVPSGEGTEGSIVTGPLFGDPFYAVGLPITEAYWTVTKVAGTYKDVLVQCFERRCLTYTPDNPPAWQVEAGNVGRHYYRWRYDAELPAQPTGVLAFARGRYDPVSQVYSRAAVTIRADGSRERVLGPTTSYGGGPTLSPDGQRVAWTLDSGEGADVVVSNTDGSDLRVVTANLAGGGSPAWSPDGALIAFNGPGGIWVMAADGSGQRWLADGTEPLWSPDGSKLAFNIRTDLIGRFHGIGIVNADGSDAHGIAGCAGPYVWTPDSREIIAYHGPYIGCGWTNVFIVGADGSNTRPLEPDLPPDTFMSGDIAFSPDGTRVAFTVMAGGNQDIYLADSDFTDIQVWSPTPGYDFNPVWSPDGRWLAYMTYVIGSEVYVVDLAQPERIRQVTYSPMTDELALMWGR